MILLIIGFSIILVISFSLVLFVTMPTKDEQILDRRVASIYDSEVFSAPAVAGPSRLIRTDISTESEWAEKIIGRSELARKIRRLIMQSNSHLTLGQMGLGIITLALGGFAATYLALPIVAIATPVAILMGAAPLIFLHYKRAKRLKAFNAELSNSIDMMSNALRAGHSVASAIGILAEQGAEPIASEFREIFRQQNFGLPLREALMELLERVPSADLRVVVTAILVQKDTGGNLGEILDRTVFVIRERVRIQGEIRVQTAQGRVTGWVLTLLPVLLLLAINIINPGYSDILLKDPFGQKLIYIGVTLLIAGALTIRHIINKIEV